MRLNNHFQARFTGKQTTELGVTHTSTHVRQALPPNSGERNHPESSSEGLMMKLKLPIPWPPDVTNQLAGKDPNDGKDGRQEKGTAEDEMVGWHHRFDGHEFE